MRDKLNCPNCGAPIVSEQCQYCGTMFYDFSSIEIGKPCFIKIKHDNNIILVKAMTTHAELSISSDTCDAYDTRGCKITSYVTNTNMDLSMEFHCIPFNKHLMEVRSV